MTQRREGGCQCGAVRYAIEGESFVLGVCHCTECQRQSGSAFGMSLLVPESQFHILQGTLKMFARKADSGRTLQCFFCPQCGTRIYHKREDATEILNIKPGTLDDTSWLKPTVQVWTTRKQAWVPMPEGLPSFEEQPG